MGSKTRAATTKVMEVQRWVRMRCVIPGDQPVFAGNVTEELTETSLIGIEFA